MGRFGGGNNGGGGQQAPWQGWGGGANDSFGQRQSPYGPVAQQAGSAFQGGGGPGPYQLTGGFGQGEQVANPWNNGGGSHAWAPGYSQGGQQAPQFNPLGQYQQQAAQAGIQSALGGGSTNIADIIRQVHNSLGNQQGMPQQPPGQAGGFQQVASPWREGGGQMQNPYGPAAQWAGQQMGGYGGGGYPMQQQWGGGGFDPSMLARYAALQSMGGGGFGGGYQGGPTSNYGGGFGPRYM